MSTVKGGRTSRRDRARATRLRILGKARELFLERGYAAATIDDIARAAGVAPQTVYYTFRTKSLLLREVIEMTGAGGPDPVPVDEREWMREVLNSESGDRALALAVEHGVDIYVRAAPLWPALHAARVSDPDVEEYFRSLAANRRSGMRRVVAHLAELGCLRDGLSEERAADIMFALFSHETFLALTQSAEWPVPEFKSWLFLTLREQLTDPVDLSTEATHGLSFQPPH